MTVEIGTEAAQLLFCEDINGIFFAVQQDGSFSRDSFIGGQLTGLILESHVLLC